MGNQQINRFQKLNEIYNLCVDAINMLIDEDGESIDRIIFIGAHGTGKTVLANELSKVIKIPVVERECMKDFKYLVNTSIINPQKKNYTSEAFQHIICSMSHWDFMRWVNAGVPCIMTRSPLDTIAYSNADNSINTEENNSNYLKLRNDKEFMDAIKKSLFIYIPIEFDIEDDGVRPVDTEFQKKVDEALKKIIYEFDITPLVVTGTVKERMESILTKLFGANVTKILMKEYDLMKK